MTLAQFLVVFFVILIGNGVMLDIDGFDIELLGLLIVAIAALVESGLIAVAFWCFEHIRFV